jgi:hypothetical protein
MTAKELLDDLRRRGATIEVDGDDLVYDAPAEVMTEERTVLLRRHKQELMDLLRPPQRDPLTERIAQQLAALVPRRTSDGRVVLVHPRYARELDELGLL